MMPRRSSTALANRGTPICRLVACLAFGTAAVFADELPDAELFEYLGSWEESDGEWVALLDWEDDEDRSGEPEPNEDEKDER